MEKTCERNFRSLFRNIILLVWVRDWNPCSVLWLFRFTILFITNLLFLYTQTHKPNPYMPIYKVSLFLVHHHSIALRFGCKSCLCNDLHYSCKVAGGYSSSTPSSRTSSWSCGSKQMLCRMQYAETAKLMFWMFLICRYQSLLNFDFSMPNACSVTTWAAFSFLLKCFCLAVKWPLSLYGLISWGNKG